MLCAGDLNADGDPDDLDSPWEFGGQGRSLFAATRARTLTGEAETPAWLSVRLRYGYDYRGETWTSEAKLDADVIFARDVDDRVFRGAQGTLPRNRAMPLEKRHRYNSTERLDTDMYRLHIGRKTEERHIIVGRQAISWGEGRLINPLDMITPRGPFLADGDLPGADALSYTEFLSAFTTLQFVFAPFRQDDEPDARRMGSRNATALVRYQWGGRDQGGDLEWNVLGGRHFRTAVLGGEMVLAKWDASLRFAYLGRRNGKNNLRAGKRESHQFALGWSYAFKNGKVPVTLEGFYNTGYLGEELRGALVLLYDGLVSLGDAPPLPDDESYFATRAGIITRNPFLFQGSIGWEWNPRTRFDTVFVLDTRSKSAFLSLLFRYSIEDETDFTAIAQVFGNRGGARGEFAGRGPLLSAFIQSHF